jgi:hypothetical protein
LTSFLRRAGYKVVEAGRPDRRLRRMNGKSDTLDAENELVRSAGEADGVGQGLARLEQELVDRFLLAGLGAGISDQSLADDRSVLFDLLHSTGRRVWAVQAQDVDGWLAGLRGERQLARSTVYDRANTVARFYDFLTTRYQSEIHARTGYVVAQPVDEFNRPKHAGYGLVRIPPSVAEVAGLFERSLSPIFPGS